MNTFFNKKRTLAFAAFCLMGLASSARAMTAEDFTFIEQTTKGVKDFIQSCDVLVKEFSDPKNTTPLRTYITAFHEKMKFVHAAFLVPIQNRINEPTMDVNSTFYQALKVTEDLIKDLNKELESFYKTLTLPENLKKALTLANALGQKVDQLATKYNVIEQKLTVLRNHFATLELTDLVKEIDGIILLVQKAKVQKKLTNAEKVAIVQMLNKRMK